MLNIKLPSRFFWANSNWITVQRETCCDASNLARFTAQRASRTADDEKESASSISQSVMEGAHPELRRTNAKWAFLTA